MGNRPWTVSIEITHKGASDRVLAIGNLHEVGKKKKDSVRYGLEGNERREKEHGKKEQTTTEDLMGDNKNSIGDNCIENVI